MRFGWNTSRTFIRWLVLTLALLAPATARAVTITRASSGTFYMESGDSLYAGYAAYRIVNDGGPDIADLWVQAHAFAGPNLSLAPNEDGLVRLGALATGDTTYAYVYLQATAATAVAENHTVSAYEGAPPGGSLLGSAVFPLTAMETIAANSNKVTTVVNGPDPPGLGGIMTLTVTGETGTLGGAGIFAITPVGFLEWPADAVELTGVDVIFSGSPNAGAHADSLLYFLTASSANTAYTLNYTFRIAAVTTQPAQFFPVQYISSGSQIKHTSSVDRTTFGPVSPSDNYLTLDKQVAPAILAATDTVTYSVTLRNASGTIDAVVDEIRDDLPATPLPAAYVPGSATYAGVGVGDPGASGSSLTFLGPFAVPAADSAVLTYDVVIPDSAGVYTNRATALAGLEQIDRTLATTDDAPAATTVTLSRVKIGLAKAVLAPPVNHGDGTYPVAYRFVIENAGNADLRQVQVSDDLAAAFAGAAGFTVDSVGVALGPLTPAPGFTGSAPDTLLLAGSDSLAVGASAEVRVFLTVTPGTSLGPYANTSRASAIGLGAAVATDVSTDGTVPDANGNGDPTDDATPTPVSFTETPELGAAKRVLNGPMNNGDGTYSLTYAFVIRNSGDVELRNLQLADDLGATFAGATGFTVDAVTVTGGALTLLPAYTGTAPDTLLLAGSDTLPAGGSATLEVALTVTPGADLGPYLNAATAAGTSPAGAALTDASADGAAPDADGNGDPTDDKAPTPVSFTESPELGLAKGVVAGPVNNGDGTYSLTYAFVIRNSGDVELRNLQLADDLGATFAGATGFTVDAVTVTGGALTLLPAYTGTAPDTLLLAGSDTLPAGGSATLEVALTVTPGADLGPYLNAATAAGTSPAGAALTDASANGAAPDANGNGDPTDDNAPTAVSFAESPELGLAKRVLGTPANNGDGTYFLTYAFVIQNSGDVPLTGLQITDDLAAAFAGATGFAVNSVTVTGGPLTANPGFTGSGAARNLLTGADALQPGQSGTLELAVTVTPDGNLGPYANSAVAGGTSPGGATPSDVSADGAVPDADGNGDPSNDSAATPVIFAEAPELGVAKRVSAGPASRGDGSFTLTYTLGVENSGDVPLAAIQLTDDLGAAFAGATGFTVDGVSPAGGSLTVNPGYTGVAPDTSLLAGTDTLAPGTSGSVTLTVTVTPGLDLGPYDNTALGRGVSPAAAAVQDASTDGAVADADGNGDPTDDSVPTPVTFTEAPELGAAKRLTSGPTGNGDGTYTLTYAVRVENSGDVAVAGVNVTEDLAATFAGAAGFTVDAVTVSSGSATPNPAFTGAAPDVDLLTGADTLLPGSQVELTVTVTVTPGSDLGPYLNTATARGTSAGGSPLSDLSTDGSLPDANGNGNPGDDSTPTPVAFIEAPGIGLAKRVTAGPAGNGDGTYTLTYTLELVNPGDGPLNAVQITDDLGAAFAGAAGFTVDAVQVAAGPVTANPGYTGTGPDTGLLGGADVLPAGSAATVALTVTVTPGGNLGPYGNGAVASGTSPGGAAVTDLSVDGAVPDANGNGDPTDDSGATFVSFTESPQIGLAKETGAGPVPNGDGTQDVTYRLRVENSGDVPLAGVQITDDLAAAFAGAAGFTVRSVTSSGLTPDPAYTGSAPNTALLSGADVVAPGAAATVDLTVRVTPGPVLGPYGNNAATSGTSPAGAVVADLSVDGAVPDADGNGDPTDDTGATQITFTERPVLGAAKTVSAGPVDNGDGTHSVAYAVSVRNLGDVAISALQMSDDLAATFSGATGFAVESVLLTEGSLTVNPAYTGTAPDTLLLAGTDVLAPGARGTVEIVVTVNPGANPGPYANSALAFGLSPAGALVRDASANGPDPDPDGDGDPTDNDVATPVLFTLQPSAVLLEKHALRPDAVVGDIVGYEVTVTNAGPLPLSGVRIEDLVPAGFKFAGGSASLRRAGPDGDLDTGDDTETAVVPQGDRPLAFTGISLAGQEAVRIRYTLIVGSGVTAGEYVNEAAPYLDGSRIGNVARAPVQVGADPLFDRTTILGKVFHDRNGDGWQSPTDATHVTVTGGFPEGVYQVNSTSLDRGEGPRLLRDRGFTSPVEVGLDLGTLSARRSPLDPPGHLATLEVVLTDPVLKPLWVTTAEGTRLRMDPDGTVTEHHVGAKAAGRTGQDIQVSRRMEADGEHTRIVYTITNEAFTENGIPGVRIATAEGWVTETDAQGRFHLADVDGGSWDRGRNLILKVDPGSLPPGSFFTTRNPRVVRVTPSLATKVNFGVRLPAQIPPQRDGHPERDSRGSDYAETGDVEAGSGASALDVPADMGAPFPPDTAPPGLEPASPGLDPSMSAVPGSWPDRAAGDERSPGSPFQLPGSGTVWITTEAAGAAQLDVGATEVALLDPEAAPNPVRFTLACNYPDFVERWELRIHRDDDELLARPVRILKGDTLKPAQTVDWDGSLDTGSLVRPGDGFLYVLRVYDSQGRFDETAPRTIRFAEKTGDTPRRATLDALHGPVQGGEILGNGNLARRGIPIHPSRVRIHGEGVAPRVRIAVDGAPVPVDAQGRFAVERLVPGGPHEFRVEAIGPDGDVWSRVLSTDVPESRFFMVGIADLTVGHNEVSGNVEPLAPDDHMDGNVYADGRVALYMKGKIRGKYLVAAHLDTHEDHLSDLAGDLHRKDARSVLRRLDPDRYYPVYGDGSTTVDDAQSQGRLYARVEWDGSSVLWGNYDTGMTGTEFAQYDRSLYGAKLHHRMGALNDYGESAAEVTAFASEAQTALGHDELAGTGGSLYYLSRHDIVQGSEKLHVEVRDRDSDRILENVALVRYRDYEIDEIQGRVILTRPLETVVDPTAPSVVRDAPLDGNRVLLLADYEYVPDGFVAGRMSVGTRAKATAGDHGALGGTYAHENRSGTDYQLWGVDGSVRAGKGTYLKAEIATSEARQAATGRVSTDGGLTFGDLPGTGDARRGQAVGVESRLDVSELTGGATDAAVSGWWKRREAGFSTARLENANERTDYGGEFTLRAGESLSLAGRASIQDEENVREDRRYGLEADFRTGGRLGLRAETRRVEEHPAAGEHGTGTLGGLRLDVAVTPDVTVYGIGQGTLSRSGAYTENNLATAGIGAQVNDGLTLRAEGSSGNRGDALRLGANFALSQWFRLDLDNTSGSLDPKTRIGADARLSDGYEVYGTYTLSPDRTDGRRGVMTLGQRKALSNQLRMFTESQVSRSRTGTGLSHVFGLELEPNRLWTLGASVQSSNAGDEVPGGLRRHVVSLSAGYDGEETRTASKLEYRKDEGTRRRTQWLTTNRLNVQTGPSLTVTAKFSLSVTEDAVDATQNARFVESGAGFAYRPVNADRWQLLGKYTFLVDMPSPGQVPERPDERLHVVSTEGLADLTRTFGVGVKTAARFGQVRLDRTGGDWLQSRFYLAVARGVVHVMKRWDGQVEYRWLRSADGEDRRQGVLVAAYRDLNRNLKAGAGFNFTSFSDDLTELGYDSRGVFVNVVGSY